MKYYSGYTALMTVIIVTIALTLISFSMLFVSLTTRLSATTINTKQKTFEVAEACLEEALLRLSLNSTYTGNQTFNYTADNVSVQCTIRPITTSLPNKVITVTATIPTQPQSPTTNVSLTVHATQLTIVSKSEVASF